MIKDARRAGRGKGGGSLPDAIQCDTALTHAREHLAAIVIGSDDAILTKNLDGIITSWNRGAEQIFGYTAEETIGEPITLIIPPERHDEERDILARICRGERVDHYETIRRRKDGSRRNISITVSPLRDAEGNIVGASKIARDITEGIEAQETQKLLLQEMQHRIKNAFAVAGSLISICAARTETSAQLAEMVHGRLQALAHAHALAIPVDDDDRTGSFGATTLHALVTTLVAPSIGDQSERLKLAGEDIKLTAKSVTPIALVLNELVTNATKHGALKDNAGWVSVECTRDSDMIVVKWSEHGKRQQPPSPTTSGFGTRLSEIAVRTQLGGEIERSWDEDGLSVALTLDTSIVEGHP